MEGSDGAIRLCASSSPRTRTSTSIPISTRTSRTRARTTSAPAREIWEQTDGRVTHFVAGIGTTGTIMGTGRRLKEYRRDIQVVAVEPDDALHGLEGLKHMASSLVPPIWHPEELDGGSADAHRRGVGHRRAARARRRACSSATRRARRWRARCAWRAAVPEGERACIVTLLPDRGDRYFDAAQVGEAL